MIEITIPETASYSLAHLVVDFNGTLAIDGALLPGVAEALRVLAGRLDVHVVTADTFGTVHRATAGLPVHVVVVPSVRQDEAKRRHVADLGADRCVAIGNGRNDALMLRSAALGIAVVQAEGAAPAALQAADVIVPDVVAALGLLQHPSRLVATLRR